MPPTFDLASRGCHDALGCMIRRPCCGGRDTIAGEVVDDLHAAEDGEAGEESHGAPDQTQLGVYCHLFIPFYLIIGRRVKIDLNHLQRDVYVGLWETSNLQRYLPIHIPKLMVEGLNMIFLT